MVARFRPQCAVVGAAEGQLVALRLSLCFGVHPLNITGGHENNESIFEEACELSKSILIQRPNGICEPLVTTGDLIVVTAGYPLNQPGTTNLVKLHKVT
jgi:pyruvate kinase